MYLLSRFWGCILMGFTLFWAGSVPAQSRSVTLLNRDWRFERGDVAGAQAPGFDDRDWQRIGLPHSFGIPYFGASQFYVGYGWYRRHLQLPQLRPSDNYALDFDAAFQEAEVWVNGRRVGHHLGGYTGFETDMTEALHAGDNVIAVRVNNLWNAQLNPRAGEHNFNGGIYRDIHLVRTKRLHVDWYGVGVTTPALTKESGPVQLATDIRNNGDRAEHFTLETTVVSATGKTEAKAITDSAVEPRNVVTVNQRTVVSRPEFWSPANPSLYRVVTRVLVRGKEVDRFETTFGFRNIRWTAENGLELNGKRLYFHGADVHQDHAGWGDAVADTGIRRDVQMIKDAGMNLIRGSHYPHSPVFSDACDRAGILLWEENSFWGTGGSHQEGYWSASAYPPNEKDQAAFEANVEQSLREMIRIHRNHPSILTWSMGNEVFFSNPELMPKVRLFLTKLIEETHKLDPSRPAAIGGVQRGDIDHIGDVAGYNGDGATLFLNPGVPSAVTEYGSTVATRPGSYDPGWGDLKGQPEFRWRGGQALWAGFDHGSIFATMGQMGMIDYFRLPKRMWFWYRNAYRGIAPPEWPVLGTPAALTLESIHSPGALRADGTDDTQLIVRVVDQAGKPLANTPPVKLRIVSGPGELPTGRSIDFAKQGPIPILDGSAAIEFHVYQSGTTVLEASSPGLTSARLTLRSVNGPKFIAGETPLVEDRPYVPPQEAVQGSVVTDLALNRPTSASSQASGHASDQANDGNPVSWWQPSPSDVKNSWWQLDLEGQCRVKRVVLHLREHTGSQLVTMKGLDSQGTWQTLAREPETRWAEGVTLSEPAAVRILRFEFGMQAQPQVTEIEVEGSPIQ